MGASESHEYIFDITFPGIEIAKYYIYYMALETLRQGRGESREEAVIRTIRLTTRPIQVVSHQ